MHSRIIHGLALAAAVIAVPALAQNYSESYNFLKGVRERDGNVVQPIVQRHNPAILNARDSGTGEGALHIVTRGRDSTWLSFLLGNGARADLQANDGTSPLHIAAQLGWIEGARLLLSVRADPNLGDRRGQTPLMLAVQRRDLAMVRMLLASGGNPNQTDNVTGNSSIDYARLDRRSAAILQELENIRRPTSAIRPAPTLAPRPGQPARPARPQ